MSGRPIKRTLRHLCGYCLNDFEIGSNKKGSSQRSVQFWSVSWQMVPLNLTDPVDGCLRRVFMANQAFSDLRDPLENTRGLILEGGGVQADPSPAEESQQRLCRAVRPALIPRGVSQSATVPLGEAVDLRLESRGEFHGRTLLSSSCNHQGLEQPAPAVELATAE